MYAKGQGHLSIPNPVNPNLMEELSDEEDNDATTEVIIRKINSFEALIFTPFYAHCFSEQCQLDYFSQIQ